MRKVVPSVVHATIIEGKGAARLKIDPAWNEVEPLKTIPGTQWNPYAKYWSMPLAWSSLIMLRGWFSDAFTYGEDVITWAWTEKQRVDSSVARRDALAPAAAETILGSDLMPFQAAGVDWMIAAGSGLLGDDMGLGKTPQAITWLHRTQLYPAVIICPNRVKWHWAVRLPRWAPGAVPYILDGAINKRRGTLAAAREDPKAVVIVNYESLVNFSRLAPYGSIRLLTCRECDPTFGDENLRSSRCHRHPKELNGFGFRAAIIDEIHRAGTPEAQQTRALWAVVHDPSIVGRWGLTGSPDNVERLWAIMHAVRPTEYPTRSKFMDRYALQAWNAYGGKTIVGLRPDTREELFRYLDPAFRRMVQSVVLPQLPPVTRSLYLADMTPGMRKSYDDLEDQLHTELPSGQLLLSLNPLVARQRRLQFAAGTVDVEKPDPEDISSWKVRIGEPSPKLDAFEEVLDELGPTTPFVVACEHRDVVDLTAERLAHRGIEHRIIIGGTPPQVAEEACQALSAGATRAIVFTSKAGGTGLDMSGAPVLIRLQRPDSLIDAIQAEKRNYRIGSERHSAVHVIDIVTRGTIEELQAERLYQKTEQLEEIARDRRWLETSIVKASPTDSGFAELVRQLDDLRAREEMVYRGSLFEEGNLT
jgi:SNF2 family DNA or RNA helicase